MGIICEFYLVNDNIIDEFSKNPNVFEKYFVDNYVNPDGAFHKEGENFFYLDKAWDIASFLISQNDTSKEKILDNLFGEPLEGTEDVNYIKALNVVKMYDVMRNISEQQIDEAYNEEKMFDPYIYRAGYFTKNKNWDYILEHVKTIFEAFKKAAENEKNILVRKG